jgi:hypothetical protein
MNIWTDEFHQRIFCQSEEQLFDSLPSFSTQNNLAAAGVAQYLIFFQIA